MDITNQNSDADAISAADRSDAIRQGKEKAKELVQTTMTSSAQRQQSQSSLKSPSVTSTRQQSLSRKRSRSGSRKPNGASESDSHDPSDDPHLRQYIYRDQMSAVAQIEQEDVKRALIKSMHDDISMWEDLRRKNRYDPGWIYGEGFQGFGNGWTPQPPPQHPNDYKIVYPSQRKRPGQRMTRELRYNRRERDAQKERLEDLVPIRLDLEIDKLRLRDTFTWNLSDRVVPPRLFAESLAEDFKIPPEHSHVLIDQIHQTMQEQIQDYHPHPFFEEDSLDPHLPYTAYKNDDVRLLVKLNITIGNHTLVDQFDWDINNPLNSPEDFARQMASDLGLSGEFLTAIAHSIREQAQMFTKSLYIAGHAFDGRPVEDADVRENLLPTPLTSVFRPYNAAKDYASYFYELNEADLERAEDAFQREQRQQKRSVNRRGGPSLPELRERPRTIRTQIVSSVVPGAAETIEQSGIYRPTTRATGRGRRHYRVDDNGSDVSESDDSEPGSPGRTQLNQGTARTRGMRGAATAAQAAMRAALPEALTPERVVPRQRRTYGWDFAPNPESGDTGLIVRVKMPRERFRKWWREYKNSPKYALQQKQRASAVPGTPLHSSTGSMPPPSHHRQPSNLATPTQRLNSSDPVSRASQLEAPAETPPLRTSSATPGTTSAAPPPPSPPIWLTTALDSLRQTHPASSFVATYRWNAAEGVHQPRIRCLTCGNGILYKTDEHEPTKNFEQHLKHPDHLGRLRERGRG